MPELPEVEVLRHHLDTVLPGRRIKAVTIRKPRVLSGTSPRRFARILNGRRFDAVGRRGKYLLLPMSQPRNRPPATLLAHLGMTGRMYLIRSKAPLPRHCSAVFALGRANLVFDDPRGFGRLSLALDRIAGLGPEPLSAAFNTAYLGEKLSRSRQSVKAKLLDQSLVAGIGNIYASEALFRARVHPVTPSSDLSTAQVSALVRAIRRTLGQAIKLGSTMPLSFDRPGVQNGLFYFGSSSEGGGGARERFEVYDREGQPCGRCRTPIERVVLGGRSTFFCPQCQSNAPCQRR